MPPKTKIYDNAELKSLLSRRDSAVVLKQAVIDVLLHPSYLSNMKVGMWDALYRKLKKYDTRLEGIILGYDKIQVELGKGTFYGPNAEIKYPVQCDCYLFQPRVNDKIYGVVNVLTMDHIGCLIHKYFNATIKRPENEDHHIWNSRPIHLGDTIVFKVIELDYTGPIPYIEGGVEGLPMGTCSIHGPSSESGIEDVNIQKKSKKKKRKTGQDTEFISSTQLPAKISDSPSDSGLDFGLLSPIPRGKIEAKEKGLTAMNNPLSAQGTDKAKAILENIRKRKNEGAEQPEPSDDYKSKPKKKKISNNPVQTADPNCLGKTEVDGTVVANSLAETIENVVRGATVTSPPTTKKIVPKSGKSNKEDRGRLAEIPAFSSTPVANENSANNPLLTLPMSVETPKPDYLTETIESVVRGCMLDKVDPTVTPSITKIKKKAKKTADLTLVTENFSSKKPGKLKKEQPTSSVENSAPTTGTNENFVNYVTKFSKTEPEANTKLNSLAETIESVVRGSTVEENADSLQLITPINAKSKKKAKPAAYIQSNNDSDDDGVFQSPSKVTRVPLDVKASGKKHSKKVLASLEKDHVVKAPKEKKTAARPSDSEGKESEEVLFHLRKVQEFLKKKGETDLMQLLNLK